MKKEWILSEEDRSDKRVSGNGRQLKREIDSSSSNGKVSEAVKKNWELVV